MKRIVLLLAAGILMCTLAACGNGNYCKQLEYEDYSSVTNKLEQLAIESNREYENEAWLIKTPKTIEKEPQCVTMTLPANYVDKGRSQEEWTKLAEKMGCKSITLNEDASVTYVMANDRKEAWMEEVKQYINASIISMTDDFDLSAYRPLKANEDYSSILLATGNISRNFPKDSGYRVYDIIQLAKLYNIYNQKQVDNVEVKFGYLDDDVYKQYLSEYDYYTSAMSEYDRALKEYESAQKSYASDIEAYDKACVEADKEKNRLLQEFENRSSKYKGKTAARWVTDYWGKYMLEDMDGELVYRAWVQDGNYWYYIDDSGYMVYDQVLNIEGIHYLFGQTGRVISGDNDKYYEGDESEENESDGMMSIVPVKPVFEEIVKPTEPVKPIKPVEPLEPAPDIFCVVESSELFDGKEAY